MAIHPTAIIDQHAEIDPTAEVGPYCVIDEHVRIGPNCKLYQGVYVTGWTEIGAGCELHPGVIVGHAPQDVKYDGSRTYCRIGQQNIFREYVTIHRGTMPESATVVGDHCFFLAGSHVGHNCSVGSHVTMINSALLGGHVEVGNRATIGGNVGIHQFVRIGELAMVAGAARVVLDVLPFALTDVKGKIAGINRIGLRRSGMSNEEVTDVREAYRSLFARGQSFATAAAKLDQQISTPAGNRLLEFVTTPSQRGFAGRPRGT